MKALNSQLLLGALAIFAYCSPIEGLRILGLLPYPAKSHSVMTEELLRHLATKGHQVDVYSHFSLEEKIPNYNEFSLRGLMTATVNNLTFDEFVKRCTSPIGLIVNMLRQSSREICQLLDHPYFQKLIYDPPRDPPYDLIILEYAHTNCFIPFGRHLNVPIVGVVSLPTLDWIYQPMGNPLNLAVHPSVFSSSTSPMNFFERLSNFIVSHVTSFTFHRMIRSHDVYVQKNFGPDFPNNVEIMKDFSLILMNYDFAMNGARPFTQSVVPVGGLHIVDRNETLPKEVQKWLDDSKDGCVYFSFGSMVRTETFPKPILKAFYKTFENIAPVRVLWKIAKPEDLPEGLPANVLTKKWFSQLQILKHKNVKAFVTHGGLMGTQESIYSGVPMLGIPIFGDQLLNVASYVKKNIATRVDLNAITEDSLTKALKEVLNNPIYKANAEKISKKLNDRLIKPIDEATFWVEYVARHGKDALKSQIVDMPIWQSNLLDVYAFIAAVIFMVAYIIIKLVKKVIKFRQTDSNLKKKKKM